MPHITYYESVNMKLLRSFISTLSQYDICGIFAQKVVVLSLYVSEMP